MTVEELGQLAAEHDLWTRRETPPAPGEGFRVTLFAYGPARPQLANMEYTQSDADPGKLIRKAAAWLEKMGPA